MTDDTAALIAAMDALSDGDTLDLNGLHLNIFVGVAGVTTGDAIALNGVPRLYNKSNITIKNGKVTADSPSVSGTKYRYPTTLTIDGCTNIILEDLILHSKGQSWGDTDASVGLTKEQRRAFAAQNGGHALLIVRSLGTKVLNCQTRLCGSVAPLYVMSAHCTNIANTFSNPGSLGYASFAFDSWAGDASVSGYPAHVSTMTDCSSHKEAYTYGSKGCVLTEDGDVSVTVNGGFFADAYPNGTARDIGFAFGCSSSQTIVNNAVVQNCANIGYTGTTNNTDYSYLYISNVHAIGLRKTVHQNEDTSVGRMYWKYTDVTADVVGGGEWVGDGDLTREATSYVAMPNDGNRIRGSFTQCTFTGATYCFINTSQIFGSIRFNECDIETNGFLWNSKGIGSGSSGDKFNRAVVFEKCAIEDISSETSAYTSWSSTTVYVYVDVSTSTITLNSVRSIESSVITTPSTFIDAYKFPQDDTNIETITLSPSLVVNSAKKQVLLPSGTDRKVLLPRPDKYKNIEFKIINSSATYNLVIRDYADTTTLTTLAPSEACLAFNDGVSDYAFKL